MEAFFMNYILLFQVLNKMFQFLDIVSNIFI